MRCFGAKLRVGGRSQRTTQKLTDKKQMKPLSEGSETWIPGDKLKKHSYLYTRTSTHEKTDVAAHQGINNTRRKMTKDDFILPPHEHFVFPTSCELLRSSPIVKGFRSITQSPCRMQLSKGYIVGANARALYGDVVICGYFCSTLVRHKYDRRR